MLLMETAAAGSGLSPFFQWMIDLLHAIAEMRTPFLDTIFSYVTKLGEETVFLVLGMLLLWCVNKKYGYRFLAMFMIGTFLHILLKALFAVPRPWELDPSLTIVESARATATDYSFPSGHTLTACLSLLGVAVYTRKKWVYAIAAVLTVLVGFSRLYLGVHTILDVGTGLILGVLILIAFGLIFKGKEDNNRVLNTVLIVSVAACIGLLIFLILRNNPDENAMEGLKSTYTLVGAAIGMLLGKILDDAAVHFETGCAWWKQCLKIALGLAIVLAVRIGLKKIFGGEQEPAILSGVRYLIMSFTGVGLYPIVFKFLFKKQAKH